MGEDSRRCERCEQRQTFHITYVGREGEISEMHLCEQCARETLSKPFPEAPLQTPRHEEVEVVLERLVISEAYVEQLLTLREKTSERRISIMIASVEAWAIDRALKGYSPPRPLTHDGWLSTITGLGGALASVRLHDRHGNMYFAELSIRVGNSQGRIDVRPSDAIALAVKAACPIYAVDRLF